MSHLPGTFARGAANFPCSFRAPIDSCQECRSGALYRVFTLLKEISMYRRFLLFVATVLLSATAWAQLPAKQDVANGLTVVVTPGALAQGAQSWEFTVVFDTHTQDLVDDLMSTAVLRDTKGNEFKPVAWDGAAPGGHHREGVLRFAPIAPQPDSVELRITRPGEDAARVFRWQLK